MPNKNCWSDAGTYLEKNYTIVQNYTIVDKECWPHLLPGFYIAKQYVNCKTQISSLCVYIQAFFLANDCSGIWSAL